MEDNCRESVASQRVSITPMGTRCSDDVEGGSLKVAGHESDTVGSFIVSIIFYHLCACVILQEIKWDFNQVTE